MNRRVLAVACWFRGFRRKHRDKGKGITLLVPFRSDGTERQEIWNWLKVYYKWHLPGAQLVQGTDFGTPFSKTCAVNSAAQGATGDIYVILDADCLIDPAVILDCARAIRVARDRDVKRWYVPYRHLYRLNRETSELVLDKDPRRFSADRYLRDLAQWEIENCDGSGVGHHFGALIQIMPSEAFWEVGGMEPRCRGWGVDDIAFVMALDTLFAKHRTTANSVWTLHHKPRGRRHHRLWEGQQSEDPNGTLGARYREAWGNVERMRALVNEGLYVDE